MGEQPGDNRRAQVSGQVVPHQDQSQGWQRQVGDLSQPGRPVRGRRSLCALEGHGRQFVQDLQQFVFQPGVQDGIGCAGHTFSPHLTRGRAEQGQQLGRAAADVLVRLAHRVALRLPGLPWLWDGLVRTGLILAPQGDADRLGDPIGQVDQPLFASVFGSTTVTTPALRLRWAVPVGHQVRVRW